MATSIFSIVNSKISRILNLPWSEAQSWFMDQYLLILRMRMPHWWFLYPIQALMMALHSRTIHSSRSWLWLPNWSLLNRNITIGKSTLTGFIYFLSCHTNVTIEDFYINNVTLTVESPFFYFAASSTSYYDTQGQQTTLAIKNGVVQNMYETPKSTLSSSSSPSKGLLVCSNQQTILKVHNLSVTNALFTSIKSYLYPHSSPW